MRHAAAYGLMLAFLAAAATPGHTAATGRKAAPKKAETRKPAETKKPAATGSSFQPIAVDAVNPRYLNFRSRATPLITSGEHYGAVLNASFDYVAYLDALRDAGFNLTRIFNGSYVETLDSTVFEGGDQNTLAPRAGKFLSPLQGDAYFARLRDFVAEAGKRNIAVEVTLFSVQYGNGRNGWGSWNLNPFNTGDVTWDKFNTLENKALVAAQDAVVRRTVTELNAFDNVFYEICNEPYFSGATAKQTREWQDHAIATVTATEAKLPFRHLIAENVANGSAIIESPNPAVSLFNFHYASPPAALALNRDLRKPIGFDETANGCASPDRRWEAWAFLMSGGATYNNLDPSFTTDDATGTKTHANCAGVRYELRNVASFLAGLDLRHMRPNRETIRQWPLFSGDAYMLEDGHVYAIYVKGGKDNRISTLMLDMPAGRYQKAWFNPRTGDNDLEVAEEHAGGPMRIQTPEYAEDVALKLVRVADAAASAAKPVMPAPTKRAASHR